MHTLQRRHYWFLLVVLAPCLFLFLVLPWPAALMLLLLLSIFLAGSVEALWHLFERWPVQSEPEPDQPPQERSYFEGYQEQPLASFEQPQPKDDYPHAEMPQAEYPHMLQS